MGRGGYQQLLHADADKNEEDSGIERGTILLPEGLSVGQHSEDDE